jgi:glucose/arabinose dehydrogenase
MRIAPAWIAALALCASCGGSGGGGGGGGTGAPVIAYPSPLSFRVGEAGTVTPTNSGGAATWAIDAALPAGLSFSTSTGAISGVPSAAATTASFHVTATNADGSDDQTIELNVTPALPSEVDSLAAGFAIEPFLSGLDIPVKMALAPDGRLFFNELDTGNVRVVDTDGNLLPTPFATVPVLTDGERGLLGLALAPDFSTSGHVVLYHSAPAGSGHGDRNRVVRLTATGDVGGSLTVLVDDLPIGPIHNAGDVKFGPDGQLYVSVGDTNDSSLAQAEGTPAGRVLRYTPAGGIPADNPVAGTPEWVRGLRNSFDMVFHPTTGGLFATENGPTSNDELNFIEKGKNYGWPTLPGGAPAGFRVRLWQTTIAPTGLEFHDGTGFGSEFANDLFVASFDLWQVRRLELSGAAFTDLDAEVTFLEFDSAGFENKPLDILRLPDGALLVSTFDDIWRLYRYP